MLFLTIVSILGLLFLFKNSIVALKWTYITFLRPPKDLKKTYGSWALITGSTDGIGRAFAFELAKKGLSLVLVSRNSTKLKRVSFEIQEKFPNTEVKLFELDFSGENMEWKVDEMREFIKGLDVGVLINNVGVTYPRAMYFHDVDEDIWVNLVKVNVKGTTYVTRAIVPEMIRRGRGAIVNIGSGAAVAVPSHPLYAVYAATKGYIDQFSRSLHVEYKSCGLDVQCQVPLYVSTRMASSVAYVDKPSMFVPSADKYVEAAIRFIGYEARCVPYWSHSLQWFFASLLPDALLDHWRLSIGIKRMKKKKKKKKKKIT